jgi:hypothetical protein
MNRRHENAKTARGKLLFKAKPPTAKPKGTENLNNSEAISQHRLPGTIFGDEYRLAGEMGRGKGFTSSGHSNASLATWKAKSSAWLLG